MWVSFSQGSMLFPLALEESNLPNITLFSRVMVFLITTHCSLIIDHQDQVTIHELIPLITCFSGIPDLPR